MVRVDNIYSVVNGALLYGSVYSDAWQLGCFRSKFLCTLQQSFGRYGFMFLGNYHVATVMFLYDDSNRNYLHQLNKNKTLEQKQKNNLKYN